MRPAYLPKEWEKTNCPFCNSNDFKIYEKFGDRLQYTYVICKSCSLVYSNPRPKYDKEFLEAAYERYFVFDPDYQFGEEKEWEYEEEIKEIISFDTKRTALLDVGSCMGDFIRVCLQHYKVADGVEISESMADFSRKKLGAEIFQEQFQNIKSQKKYSCIHMSHVIEHIPNPNEWMQNASKLLDDEGVFVICVPNIRSLAREVKLFLKRIGLRKGKWKESWRTPDHLFEPTIKSMKYLCDKNGFEILDYYTYSRKDPVAKKFLSRIFQRRLKMGSNLRYYLKKSL